MGETLRSFVPSAAFLGIAFAIAIVLTVVRAPRGDRPTEAALVRLFLIGVAVQGAHFLEELATGFAARFPAVFDRPALPDSLFVAFNLVWIAIWIASAVGLRAGVRVAWIPVWFFAIAMMVNGVGHPLLALRAGSYFPGLVTAPIAGVLGVFLFKKLLAATALRAEAA